jgi:hypothetical protein
VHTGTFFPATLYAVAVSEDGKVYVGGQFSFAGSTAAENVAMWDGTAWHPLGSGVNQFVYAIATKGDEVYVGGKFTSAGDQSANYVARWNAATQTWSALGSGMNGYVWDIAVDDQYVYAVGDFTAAGAVPTIDMARWDGTSWSKLGQGIDFTFNAVLYSIALDGDRVVLGGDFESVWVPGGTGSARVNGLLIWDSTNDEWFDVAGGVTRKASGSDVWGSVYDLAIANGALYVTGRFDKVGGQVAANGVARFDGQAWSALGSSLGGGTIQEGYALAVSGQDLYVGGRFTTAGGITSGKVARYDMQTQVWAGPTSCGTSLCTKRRSTRAATS